MKAKRIGVRLAFMFPNISSHWFSTTNDVSALSYYTFESDIHDIVALELVFFLVVSLGLSVSANCFPPHVEMALFHAVYLAILPVETFLNDDLPQLNTSQCVIHNAATIAYPEHVSQQQPEGESREWVSDQHVRPCCDLDPIFVDDNLQVNERPKRAGRGR